MRWLALLLYSLPLLAGPAADTVRAMRENTFDRGECYRVRDLTILRPEIRIYLTDGYLIFSKPVAGRRIAAVFSTDVEGGDGEVIVMPPVKGERRSLASYTGSPNLNEHIRTALFLGTGDLHDEIVSQMSSNPTNRKVPEMGALLDEQWGGVLRNLVSSYEPRLAMDLLAAAPREDSIFAALFAGTKLGNFDIVFDPRASEEVTIGQVANRENRTFFDVWASFVPRNYKRRARPIGSEVALSDYRIEATVSPDLSMSAVTRVKVKPAVDELRVLPLEIARNMQVLSASVDGAPAEVMQREALRANLGRFGNEAFLVVPAEPMRAGREYELQFRHTGNVVHKAGDRVFYVSARANWYPASGLQYSTYDLRFRYPRDLDMVGAGEVVEDSTEGEWRTTRRRTSSPVRMAGFNLGSYRHTRVAKAGYVVEVYANRSLEAALQPKPRDTVAIPQPQLPRARRPMEVPMITDPGPSPAARLQALAADVADALQFMATKFGPPALPFLTVSPIPGTFGQGFPGLIYLSTLSYLRERPAAVRATLSPSQELFFNEILQAHETAHQWWGNVLTSAGYHDYWLMEALANYSALLYLEKHKGPRTLEQALTSYRDELLLKGASGQEVDAAGPIVLGTRLESSLEPRAWRAVTYGKGSWILHMLRRLMGDESFFRMLAEMRKRYDRKQVSTEQFRELAAGYLPPKSADPKLEGFFDQWAYATGIPGLKMTYSVKGKLPALKLTGTISQTDVPEDFSVMVPVEIHFLRGTSTVHWVRTSSEPVSFTVPLRQQPAKVLLDPHWAVLRR